MAGLRLALALLAASAAPLRASEQLTAAQLAANPLRKVVTMLQSMQKKVEEEGKAEKALYDKFMCYCRTGNGDLAQSVAAAETKVPSVSSDIEAAQGKLEQAKATLQAAQSNRAAAKDATAQATALREKEAAAFAVEKADYDTNLAALAKAIAALGKGVAGSFLQTAPAQALRRLAVSKLEMRDADRQALVSFLSQGAGYAPQSGEIIGILKELSDSMSKGLADASTAEAAAVQNYQGLVASKQKEVGALTSTVESKMQQIGELGMALVQMQEDLTDTQAALAEDHKFVAELAKSCATKTSEWEERSKTRADEVVALAETIKVLNDDDALDLFKKTLPSASASFVQMRGSKTTLRARALAVVRGVRRAAAPSDRTQLDLLALTLTGKKAVNQGGFDQVVKMIDNMVEVLKAEQVDDDSKKEYCGSQFDQTDDKKKALDRTVSDADNAIATAEEGLATLKEEMAALEAGIKALDKSVAQATEQRKAENVEFKDLMAADGAAKELMLFAKNRLNKFYNPKLYKAPPKRELSTADRISESMGGGGTGNAMLVEVSAHAHRRDAPLPPPETWGAYQKKSGEGTGVITMIDLLIKDLDKEMVEAGVEEKDAQADYEAMMADSADKRAADSKSLTQKGSAKANVEAQVEAHREAKAAGTKELMLAMKFMQSLHAECDWLLQYFETRKAARRDEVEALGKAKAVLNGADYALVQTRGSSSLRR